MSEAQKPVNEAYRSNWDAIWGKKQRTSYQKSAASTYYKPEDFFDNYDIMFHRYETYGYEGDYYTLGRDPEGRLFYNRGGHCSCNRPKFEPTFTTKSQLLAHKWQETMGEETELFEAILNGLPDDE